MDPPAGPQTTWTPTLSCRHARYIAIVLLLVLSLLLASFCTPRNETTPRVTLPSLPPRKCLADGQDRLLLPAALAPPFSALLITLLRRPDDHEPLSWLHGHLPFERPLALPPSHGLLLGLQDDKIPDWPLRKAMRALNDAQTEDLGSLLEWWHSVQSPARKFSRMSADAQTILSQPAWKRWLSRGKSKDSVANVWRLLFSAFEDLVGICASTTANSRGASLPFPPLNMSQAVVTAHDLQTVILSEVSRVAKVESRRVHDHLMQSPSVASPPWHFPSSYSPHWAPRHVATRSGRPVMLFGPSKVFGIEVPSAFHRRHLNGLMALYARAEWTSLLGHTMQEMNDARIRGECDFALQRAYNATQHLLLKTPITADTTMGAMVRLANQELKLEGGVRERDLNIYGIFASDARFLDATRSEGGRRKIQSPSRKQAMDKLWRNAWIQAEKDMIHGNRTATLPPSSAQVMPPWMRCLLDPTEIDPFVLAQASTWIYWLSGASPDWRTTQRYDTSSPPPPFQRSPPPLWPDTDLEEDDAVSSFWRHKEADVLKYDTVEKGPSYAVVKSKDQSWIIKDRLWDVVDLNYMRGWVRSA